MAASRQASGSLLVSCGPGTLPHILKFNIHGTELITSGIVLVIVSQLLAAVQVILEERLLKEGLPPLVVTEERLLEEGLPPLVVTGVEGVIGLALMLVGRARTHIPYTRVTGSNLNSHMSVTGQVVLPACYVIPGAQRSSMAHGSLENRSSPIQAYTLVN